METENEGGSTSETASGESNKRLKNDCRADAVSSFAESFKEYVSKERNPPRSTSQEIYDVVSSVLEKLLYRIQNSLSWFLFKFQE
ncbi:hypothetical protein SOVF_202170 [Spinacia oleracea]|nr:hypothetical protein SOVF_202170 [Spinacia oleracea]